MSRASQPCMSQITTRGSVLPDIVMTSKRYAEYRPMACVTTALPVAGAYRVLGPQPYAVRLPWPFLFRPAGAGLHACLGPQFRCKMLHLASDRFPLVLRFHYRCCDDGVPVQLVCTRTLAGFRGICHSRKETEDWLTQEDIRSTLCVHGSSELLHQYASVAGLES